MRLFESMSIGHFVQIKSKQTIFPAATEFLQNTNKQTLVLAAKDGLGKPPWISSGVSREIRWKGNTKGRAAKAALPKN